MSNCISKLRGLMPLNVERMTKRKHLNSFFV